MSVELVDFMGNDDSVVNAARVSFYKNAAKYTEEQNIKLLSYLSKHNHWSPFAHTALSFRIKAPLFVRSQLVKHQVGGVWNEVSRRYVDDEPEFYLPKVWRGKPQNAKQGSSGVVDLSTEYLDDSGWSMSLHEAVPTYCEDMLDLYNSLLAKGVAPEQARMVLPQNTMTEWIWTGSLMFFARVCKQRLDLHAQEETREVAQAIANAVPKEFEHSWKALMNV